MAYLRCPRCDAVLSEKRPLHIACVMGRVRWPLGIVVSLLVVAVVVTLTLTVGPHVGIHL